MKIRSSPSWRYGVPATALVAGLLFATSATTSHGFDLRVTGRDDVNTLAAREQRTVIAQGKALTALERKVQAATAEAAKTDSRSPRRRTRRPPWRTTPGWSRSPDPR